MSIPRILAAGTATLSVLCLCACAQLTGLAHGDAARNPDPVPSIAPFSELAVTFGAQLQQSAVRDPRLSTDAVAAAVEQELRARQLYAPAMPGVHRTLVITVQDFTNRLASNTSVLGYTFRELGLLGDVQVKDGSATTAPPFDVHARVRQTNHDASTGAGSLDALYARFAVQVVAALRGVAPPD